MAKITLFPSNAHIVGYILAGGESRRFEYETKGLKLLNKKPLVQHVIERFKPQVDALNINSHFIEYAQFGLPTVGETHTFLGPLSGLFHCMQHMRDYYPNAKWLAITPCDTPFLPKNMMIKLTTSLDDYCARCFRYEGQLQPTFSIWHRDLFDDLESAVNQHQWGGLKIFMQSLGNAVNIVEYPQQTINPFFNINSEEDRLQAIQILEKQKQS